MNRTTRWVSSLAIVRSWACMAMIVMAAIVVGGSISGCEKKASEDPKPVTPVDSSKQGAAPQKQPENSGATGSPKPTDASALDRTGWPPVIRVGLVPTEGGADTRERFLPMQDYLNKALGVPVEMVSAASYLGVITAMENKQIEFAGFGPKSYIEAAKRAGAEALVVELNREKERGYRCIFIVPAASKVTSLREAKGLKFAFTDVNSTSGYLIPAMIIRDETGQMAEDFFSEVRFSGAHGTSVLKVEAGEIEIAATNDLDMNRMFDKGAVRAEGVRVVFTSDVIPGAPVSGRRDLPASLKEAFKAAMIEMSKDDSLLEKFQNGGYAPVTDQEYDVIRATQAFLDQQEAQQKSKPSSPETQDKKSGG